MSTLKVNKIEATGTTDGGIEIDSTGHVQIDGVQLPTSGQLSNRNLIINGAMRVAQRGTSSTDGNNYCSLDRFRLDNNEGGWTFSREDLANGDPFNLGFRNFARLTNDTVSTANDRRRKIQQYIEAQNVAQSGWNYASSSSYVTFSFWVRSSVAGTYYFALQTQDQSPNKSYAFGETLVADTWTKVEKTIPGASSLVINNDTGSGLRVIFNVDHGTDFTGTVTLDSWEDFDNSLRTPDTSTNWTNTADATFDITGVQLEVGEKATPFEHRSYSDELAKCQRYYETTYPAGFSEGHNFNQSYPFSTSHPLAFNFIASDDTLTSQSYTFQVSKRGDPTVRLFNANTGSANQAHTYKATGGTNTSTSISVVNTSPTHVLIGTGLSAVNECNESYFHIVGDSEL